MPLVLPAPFGGKTVWYPVFTSDDGAIYPEFESVEQTVEMQPCMEKEGVRTSGTEMLCTEMFLGSYSVTVLSTHKADVV